MLSARITHWPAQRSRSPSGDGPRSPSRTFAGGDCHGRTAGSQSPPDDSLCTFWVVAGTPAPGFVVSYCRLLMYQIYGNLTQPSRNNNLAKYVPITPESSRGSMSSCLEPHGHRVSTTSSMRLLCGIFWTLNGRSQPEA